MSDTEQRHNIYVAIVGEVPPLWRPVEAVHVGGEIYEIVSVNSNPEEQKWQFETGTRVRCAEHAFMDGKTGKAATELA